MANTSTKLNPKLTVAKVNKILPLSNTDAKFISLSKIEYTSPDGANRQWEMATRTTRPANGKIDGVAIVSILNYGDNLKKLLLQKQFRPPVNGICIEFPAGLVDPNETIEQCALRELKEETGYVGKISGNGNGNGNGNGGNGGNKIIYNDPGFCNTTTAMVKVDIDMTLEENIHPVSNLQDGEFIECFEISIDDLYDELIKLDKQGYLIDARVSCVAEGLKLSKSLC